MSYNNFNIAVFESTMKKINDTPSIYKAVEAATAAQKYYFGDVPAPTVDRFEKPCELRLTRSRTVDAGRKVLKDDPTAKVAILNFADRKSVV